jgi:uncharacterized protein
MDRLGKERTRLLLRSDGAGHWTDRSGQALTAMNGAVDLDYASPFTNTIAIKRLALKDLQSETIQVVFVHLPDLRPTLVLQRYTLKRSNQNEVVYRYEGLNSGFTADITVDSDGLVIEYPGLAKRVWKKQGNGKPQEFDSGITL